LSGCIPTISRYYDIIGQGDKRLTAGCSMNVEADLSIRLSDSVNVVFWGPAERKSLHQTILSVGVTIMDDTAVSLSNPVVWVTAKRATAEFPIGTIHRAAAVVSPSCEPPRDSEYKAPTELMRRVPGVYQEPSLILSLSLK
jgi:hypothetical protein